MPWLTDARRTAFHNPCGLCFIHDVQICRAILTLASSLHIEMVAEGIEMQKQATFLHHAGCAIGQGYLFAMPQAVEEYAEHQREGHCSIDPARAAAVTGMGVWSEP